MAYFLTKGEKKAVYLIYSSHHFRNPKKSTTGYDEAKQLWLQLNIK